LQERRGIDSNALDAELVAMHYTDVVVTTVNTMETVIMYLAFEPTRETERRERHLIQDQCRFCCPSSVLQQFKGGHDEHRLNARQWSNLQANLCDAVGLIRRAYAIDLLQHRPN